MINESSIALRSKDSNFDSLDGYLNKQNVNLLPFNDFSKIIVNDQNFVLLTPELITPTKLGISLNTKINGGLMVSTLQGLVGTATTDIIKDSFNNILNIVFIRDKTTKQIIKNNNNKQIFGLLQTNSTSIDGDLIGSNNLQMSFVSILNNVFVLEKINCEIQFKQNVINTERMLPKITMLQQTDIESLQEIVTVNNESSSGALTAGQQANLANQSGVNTGDQDLSGLATKDNVLQLNNITPFSPVNDYEPATRKFVLDNGIKNLVKTTTQQLLAEDMMNTIITNYGQTEDIELTLPVAQDGIRMIFQYSVINNKVIFKSGENVVPLIDYLTRCSGFNFKIPSPSLGEECIFKTIKINENEYKWVINSDKNNACNADGYDAKSIIIDCADRWNIDSAFLGMRSIDFLTKGKKLNLTSSNITCYCTNIPWTECHPMNAFISSKPKTGSTYSYEWRNNSYSNQRVICVFNSQQNFEDIIINNLHEGGTIKGGIKNIKIYISTDTITDVTYNAPIPNSKLIFNGQIRKHVASDVEDPQKLTLIE